MEEQIAGYLMGFAIGLVIVAILVVIFRWLWNSTMPEVFAIREVSFWQAFKILLLAAILFGGHRVTEVPQQVSTDPEPATVASE